MARHSKPKAAGSSDPALDISSLIDVCFLLLIYFIATSVIAPREQDLPVGLPRPGGDESVATGPMLIRIDSAGTVSAAYGDVVQTLDADPGLRELPLLSAQLEMYVSGVRAAGEMPLVQIDVGESTTQQRVIDVLNALAAVGIRSVTFADLQVE